MDVNLKISAAVIFVLLAEALFSVALPVAALVIWKLKCGLKLRPFLMGFAAFLVFALVGQQVLHMIVLNENSAIGVFVTSRPWLNALYVGLTAGVFEETARLLMFRTALRDDKEREHAVAYGIGHGGFECIAALGLSVIGHLMMAIMLNTGSMTEIIAGMSEGERATLAESVQLINNVNIPATLLSLLERICMLALQISLSVIVFAALHQNRMWLYPTAILAHAGVEIVSALYQAGFAELWLVEVLLVLYVAVMAIWAVHLYKLMPSLKPVEVDQFGRPVQKKKKV